MYETLHPIWLTKVASVTLNNKASEINIEKEMIRYEHYI